MDFTEVEPFIRWLETEGFNVRCSWGINCRHHQYSGRDDERARAFQELLDDPDVRAIVCLRGGYGTVRIIDQLDWTTYKIQPKWVVGYSDITVLHAHVHQLGFRSMHAAMPVQFTAAEITPPSAGSDLSVPRRTETDMPAQHPDSGGVPAHWRAWLDQLKATDHHESDDWSYFSWSERCHVARPGLLDGLLVGGNLSVLYGLLGSQSFPDLKGKILFLEDVDEYLYHIDRMMTALKRAGMLEGLGGLLIGDFTDMKDHSIPFGSTWEEIIMESVSSYNYPVIFGVPAGHGAENYPLEMGIKLRSMIQNKRT